VREIMTPSGCRPPRVVCCRWKRRRGDPNMYDCPDCLSYTGNPRFYAKVSFCICPKKDRRKENRRSEKQDRRHNAN